ncbi:DUF768 domain-containing protein [Mesorhizobium sp. B2-3-3]|nr:DUF768 domain-containing protein [Mesorhizobium sp. B2-3-3]
MRFATNFLHAWISDHLPKGAVDDPAMIGDLLDEARKSAHRQRMADSEIEHEVGEDGSLAG